MKQYILHISLIILAVAFSACAPVEDDIFTIAHITVVTDDNISITGVQAQVKLTNVNTRQVTTAASFEGDGITIELLRGAYQIGIEGVATCVTPDGTTRHRQFRCQTEYVEIVGNGINEITLKIIFLD